jgi:hypothetical protein
MYSLVGCPPDALPWNILLTVFCIESWSSFRRPASEHSVHLFLFVLFPLPKLSAEAFSFAMKGAKNKTAGEHGCSFGRGNEHLPGLLVLLFWPALGLEGQLEGHLFFGAGSNRPANGSSAFVGDGIIDDFNYFCFPGTEIERIAFD